MGQASPQLETQNCVANALDVSLAEFLSVAPEKTGTPAILVVPEHLTPVIGSPDGKCELKILGPVDLAGRVEWYHLCIQPGGIFASEAHERGAKEHLSVFSGQIRVQSAEVEKKVKHGETARYPVDVPHTLSNPGKTLATVLLVVEYA